MSNIKQWVLNVKKTQTFANGTKIETLESYEFSNLEDASDTQFYIDQLGSWDTEDIGYMSTSLQYLELFSLEEKG